MTGAFDIVCELLPHIAIILYRIRPNSHLFLSRLFLFAAITTFFGTVCETLVIFYLFGSLWQQWQLAFKVATPVLHCAFSATQLHGSRMFWLMWRKQERLLAQTQERGDLEEAPGQVTEDKKEGAKELAEKEVKEGLEEAVALRDVQGGDTS